MFLRTRIRLSERLQFRVWHRHPRPSQALARHGHCAQVALQDNTPIARVDPRYLSYSIDISVVAGGFWWEGSSDIRKGLGTLRVPPLDLSPGKLDLFVQALGPAYLRVGGSEADKVHYFDAPEDEPHSLVLTRKMWDELHAFIQRNDLKFSFTIKYGLFKRSQHGDWNGSELEKLLQYSREHQYHIDVCELGNELNAYWAFHGLTSQPRARKLAVDYLTFRKTIAGFLPDAKIIGPGSAFWPKLGETIRPFSNITRRFLETSRELDSPIDIIDWHYYPFQSERSPIRTRKATLPRMLKPKALNDFSRYAQQMRLWRDEFFPDAEMWTGETGSAQCGGQAKISDRFASCFWFADQLGQGALCAQKVMIRQSLIGGEYGMIDRLTMKPRPDFWLSWCWKQLMGEEVYSCVTPSHMLRCYCHKTPEVQGKTLLLINLSGKPLKILDYGFGKKARSYSLTAKRLSGKKLYINGIKPRFQKGAVRLTDFDKKSMSDTLPPYSINFWCFE